MDAIFLIDPNKDKFDYLDQIVDGARDIMDHNSRGPDYRGIAMFEQYALGYFSPEFEKELGPFLRSLKDELHLIAMSDDIQHGISLSFSRVQSYLDLKYNREKREQIVNKFLEEYETLKKNDLKATTSSNYNQ